ncbi:PKD domain-containing protein [Pedobacter sp. MC2016-05]|uniref:PKD domain-containing protein n=1 Tax=Pedobacter sp. MC2016-05 TaxID=2994474 RepID=UPI002247465E|nr:PKD domain-containing protein [Pedobacter sp. MC2016-05]MCX2475952.1 PKD domain-containing protein [Pedobacter sp. MC2016-05]
MKRAGLLALLIFLLVSMRSRAQNVSNEGTDFWAVFPTHVPSQNSLANITVFVTSKFNTEVTVSCGTWSLKKTIPVNQAIRFDVPRASAYIEESESNTVLLDRAIRIRVTDGLPKVSAYTHIWGRARSAASLILPFETLGQTYYSMNYTQSEGGKNYLAIVAAEDNTSVIIHEKGGSTLPVTLAKAGDVYEYITGTGDLTGVYVETDKIKSSCKRFAAFSGSSAIVIGPCTGSQDPLYQQLYPTASWGRNYGVVPLKDRRYILRILAQEDNTKFTLDGTSITLNKGEFYESGILTQSTFISADKLISVAQYSLTQNCSSALGNAIIGDPEMVILNPVEFSIKTVTVFSSDLESIVDKYINVLIRTNKVSSFKINGVAPAASWSTLIGNSTYSFAQIPVIESSLTLTADDGFNAIAYGFGNAESYSYSAGTNLSSNNYLTVIDETRNEESPNGCIGQTVDFKVNLPYEPDRITWTLEGGVPETVLNPEPDKKIVNGQTSYVYRYPVNKTYTQTGEYHLEVVSHVPTNANNCITGDITTNYVFNIYDLPITDFEAKLTGCANTEVQFTDKSDSKTTDFSIVNWLWDFRDGTTSTDQNPKHAFLKEGKYKVLLMVKSGTGCYSEPVEKEIEIYPRPVSNFKSPAETCTNTEFTIQDLSEISNDISVNTIQSWAWNFDDGTAISTDQNPKHSYTKIGKYTISLVTTSSNNCVSEAKKWEINVTELPKAGFKMPDICLKDAVANFTNTAVNIEGTADGLTYKWDFGDKYLSAAHLVKNTSSAKDGSHTYTVADNYDVTLTITNTTGCTDIVKQQFTVNGSVPKANFEPLITNNYCSNTVISIKNTSTVDFGKVTKIEVYKDLDNQPESMETFNFPIPDQIDLNYAPFGSPLTKNVQIKVVAYSGGQCSDFIIKTITLNASPTITVDEILPVCENDGSVVINQFNETTGISGIGVYSSDGNGLKPDGTFNPKLAGLGPHNITYTFTADNGCSATVTKSIFVNKSPVVDGGSIIYILAGGEIQIPAVATGEGLKYEWLPATGLNNNKIMNPIASPEKDIDYTLTVTTSPEQCTTVLRVSVKVLQAVNPPSSFTPNGDGINDVWNIKYLESYPKATVQVFNRNGSRIFFSAGYRTPFDGNYQNEQLPVGVYYYIINPRNGRKNVTGPLTIIR